MNTGVFKLLKVEIDLALRDQIAHPSHADQSAERRAERFRSAHPPAAHDRRRHGRHERGEERSHRRAIAKSGPEAVTCSVAGGSTPQYNSTWGLAQSARLGSSRNASQK